MAEKNIGADIDWTSLSEKAAIEKAMTVYHMTSDQAREFVAALHNQSDINVQE